MAIPRALRVCVSLSILLAAEMQAAKAARARIFAKYASGIITTPNQTLSVIDGSVECAVACGAIPICMGFSVTPNPNVSSGTKQWSTCRLGFGTFQWIDDPASTLHGVDIGPLNGYTLQKDGRFYKKYAEWLPYMDSLRACDADGAAAADSYGQQGLEIFMKFLEPSPGTVQFVQGMYRTSNFSMGRWITFTGNVFTAQPGDQNQFWLQQPFTPEPSNDQCAVVGLCPNQPWPLGWDADNCDRTDWPLPRVCVKPIGYERATNGKYYKMHYELTDSHARAQEICHSEGGNLANLLTQENYDAVEVYRIRVKFGTNPCKIGGTDEGHEGNWMFPDGVTMLRTQDIPNWSPNEPNNDYNGTENCLDISSDMRLNDLRCKDPSDTRTFLCEIIP